MGTELNDVLTGTAGSDTLDGGAGADTLNGDAGDDFYIVDTEGDAPQEKAGEGWDTVKSSISYRLREGSEVEALVLTGNALWGTGNALDNLLLGNSRGNVLDGGLGADFMSGGGGDDTYIVDNIGDQVFEMTNRGVDTVKAGITFDLRSANHVEHLTLTGDTAIDGTGNGLNNRLTGNAAGNRLDGGAGNDTLEGGNGSDTYVFKGRFGGDVVHDHDTSVAPAPQQPVYGGFPPLVFVGDGFNFSAIDPSVFNLSIVDIGGGVTTGPVTNLSATPTLAFDFGLLTGSNGVLDFSAIDTGSLGLTFNYYDLHGVSLWGDQPNTDTLRFEDVSHDRLWFRQAGQDLEVSVVGTTDKVLVQDWFASPKEQIELTYDAGNAHVLRHDKVQGLVTAMAAFQPQALSGNATLLAARDTAWVTAG